MQRDQRHDNAYIFGAVCPARDKGVALVLPAVNIDAMNLHLAAIATAVSPNAHAVVIIDGAGWHQEGGALLVPYNISLLRLPPYSPELNAQENIWQYLRQNFLAHRIFDTYDAIVDACCEAWNALIAETGRITSLHATGSHVSSHSAVGIRQT
jgi:DDE superfamily endonuclease